MKARFLLVALAINSYAPTVSAAASGPLPVATFDRKPVIVSAADGTLLAWFVRTNSSGQVVTVQESRDHGSTWTEETTQLALPAEPGRWGGLEALVDRSDEVHLFITNDAKTAKKPFRRRRYDIWHVRSEAGRTTWQQPKPIWQGYTGALNSVIQLRSGRILLPFSYLTPRTWRNRGKGLDAFTYRGQFDCTLVYSDDNGTSWHRSPSSLKVTTPRYRLRSRRPPRATRGHLG
ncbi:MAG: sialidase family protein [Pirellulales bacterium]